MTTLETLMTAPQIFRQRRDGTVAFVLFALLSIALAVLFAYNGRELFAIAGGFALLGVAAILFTGNVFKWATYCFFCVQYTVSYFFVAFSTLIAGIGLLFFPVALFGKDTLNVFRNIPNTKQLLLMLLGGAVSLIYMTVVNRGIFEYYVIYDLYFLFGLIFAYQMYFLFKLKILDPKKLVECIGISGAVVICVLIALYVRRDWSLMLTERFGMTIMRRENPNILAMFVDMALPCAFFTAFFETQNRMKKFLFYGLSLFYVCILLMTASRGSLPGIAMLFVFFAWHKRSNKLLITTMLMFGAIMFATFGAGVIQRTFSGDATDLLSSWSRIELWQAAVRMMKENFYIFGVGMENYALMKFDYGVPVWLDVNKTFKSHNLFIDIWVGWGVLGLAGWLAFHAALIKKIWHKRKNCAMANSVVFAIAAFSIHGLVDSACGHAAIMSAYFALMGVGLFLMTQKNNEIENNYTLNGGELS